MKRFENKIALVTGASRGIGYSTARWLAREGATVVITAHGRDHLDEAVETLTSEGLNVSGELHDATDLQSCISAVENVIARYGRVDVLVNNAGGTDLRKDGPAGDLDLDYFDTTMHFNVRSMLATIKTVLPSMLEHGGGSIVNVASIGGVIGDFRGTLYGTSKAGVVNLTRYVATQYGKKGVRCNCVAPGLILTDAAMDNLDERTRNIFLRQNCTGYFGRPDDIASAIAFLASDEARYITGQTLIADGGLTCHNPTTADLMGL